jgi:hypothetical protein
VDDLEAAQAGVSGCACATSSAVKVAEGAVQVYVEGQSKDDARRQIDLRATYPAFCVTASGDSQAHSTLAGKHLEGTQPCCRRPKSEKK